MAKWFHSKYYRKQDDEWVDRYNRNESRSKTGRPIARDVIKHQRQKPAAPTRLYKIRRR